MFGALSGIAATGWIFSLILLLLICFLALTAVLSRDPDRRISAQRVLAMLLRHKDGR